MFEKIVNESESCIMLHKDNQNHYLSVLECCPVIIKVLGPGTRLTLRTPIVLAR